MSLKRKGISLSEDYRNAKFQRGDRVRFVVAGQVRTGTIVTVNHVIFTGDQLSCDIETCDESGEKMLWKNVPPKHIRLCL